MITKWVNIDDAGAPHVLLRRVAAHVPVVAIDTIWIFPTRRSAGIESTVFVLSIFDGDDAQRRRVGAIRFIATRDRKGRATVEDHIHEYARAPASAIQRAVDGVMRRLRDEAAEPPRPHAIDGDIENWRALLRELGGPDAADDTGAPAPDVQGDEIPAPDEPAPDHAAAPAASPTAGTAGEP